MPAIKFSVPMGGKEVQCRLLMGALRRYTERTGKELDNPINAVDSLCQVYCYAEAEAARTGKQLPLTFEEWLDTLDVEEGAKIISTYNEALANNSAEGDPTDEEKKSAPEFSNS